MNGNGSIAEVNLWFSAAQRQRFRDGEQSQEWARDYPEVFDEDDLFAFTRKRVLVLNFKERSPVEVEPTVDDPCGRRPNR